MTLALVDVLEGLAGSLETATSREWYPGAIPADADAPFGRLSFVDGSPGAGLAAFPDRLVSVVQLSAVGRSHIDAGWLLDKAREHLAGLSLPLSVSASTAIRGVYVEGSPSPPIEEGTLLTVSEDYRLLIGAA